MLKSANILLPVAKVIKSFGTKGGLLIRFAPSLQFEINKKRPVFIYFDGLPVPFFIETLEEKGTEKAFVILEGIDSLALAAEVEGEFVYAEKPAGKKSGKKGKEEIFSPDSLTGFSVYDADNNMVGRISAFYDYPGNPCVGVIPAGSKEEKLLPLHEDLILDFNPKKEQIALDLPSGLLDI
jgi:16S rRNA processing protein RimM